MVSLKEVPNLSLVKCPELDEIDEGLVVNAVEHFFKKVGDDAKLQLSFKEYKKGGLRAQHEVHGKLVLSGKTFFAEYEEWKLLEVIQHVLKTLEKEVAKASSKEK